MSDYDLVSQSTMEAARERIAEEQAAMAYSAGDWGGLYDGPAQFRPNYEAGKAAFIRRGGPPDLFHNITPAWEL